MCFGPYAIMKRFAKAFLDLLLDPVIAINAIVGTAY